MQNTLVPAGIVTEHSVGRAAVAATVRRGVLSSVAKATVPWSTANNRDFCRGEPRSSPWRADVHRGERRGEPGEVANRDTSNNNKFVQIWIIFPRPKTTSKLAGHRSGEHTTILPAFRLAACKEE